MHMESWDNRPNCRSKSRTDGCSTEILAIDVVLASSDVPAASNPTDIPSRLHGEVELLALRDYAASRKARQLSIRDLRGHDALACNQRPALHSEATATRALAAHSCRHPAGLFRWSALVLEGGGSIRNSPATTKANSDAFCTVTKASLSPTVGRWRDSLTKNT